jgi:hypothetical protein
MKELTSAEFAQLTRTRRATYMFRRGAEWGFEGNLISVPIIAASAAFAQRGEKLSTLASSGTSAATFPLFQGAIAAGVSLIPGVGPPAALFISMFAATIPTALVERGVHRGVRAFTQFGRDLRRLETGQGYSDNLSKFQQRMGAVQDISATMQASRRFLGQEARLLHR